MCYSITIGLPEDNALRFAFQSPRSTKDRHFTITGDKIPDDADRIRSLLNDALRFAERRFRVKAKCQLTLRRSARVIPRSPACTMNRITLSISLTSGPCSLRCSSHVLKVGCFIPYLSRRPGKVV